MSKQIDVRGVSRVSKDDIEKIVSRQTEKSGVWNADLVTIREDIEKITQVKSAVVSRVLPDGLRVNLIEREPRAVVRLERGDLWADDGAVLFDLVGKNDDAPAVCDEGLGRKQNRKSGERQSGARKNLSENA